MVYVDAPRNLGRIKEGRIIGGAAAVSSSFEGPLDGKPPATTALRQANVTFDVAAELASRVIALADRLGGPYPADAAGSAERLVGGGVLGTLSATALAVRDRLYEAHAALDRIDSALGD